MSKRSIQVFGHAPIGTKISVQINGVLQTTVVDGGDTSPFDSSENLIYRFETDTQNHGFTRISIRASNNIKIGRSLVTYPAVWVDSAGTEHWGKFTRYQVLIPNPKFLVRFDRQLWYPDPVYQHLCGEWLHDLDAGVTMEFYHLHRGSTDAVYLHLDHLLDRQKEFVTHKHLAEAVWSAVPCHGILTRIYPLKESSEHELELLQAAALADFSSDVRHQQNLSKIS